jgi:hypothetical protein
VNDDKLKKIKDILSGSLKKIEVESPEELTLPNNQDPEDLANSFLNEIIDSAWIAEELEKTITPCYLLSKDKESYWLFNVTLKILTKMSGGVELIPIEEGKSESVCLIGFSTYSVPNDLIEYIGWN